jgi:hypothetical protein
MSRALSVRFGALATAIVATGSAVLSWDALSWGAGQLGVDGHLTWLYPVVIDGTIGVGTVCALALRGAGVRIRGYVWLLLGGAIGASVVGNGAHAAGGSVIHVVGAAVPAIALAATLHLLVILVRHAPGAAVVHQVADVDPEIAEAAAELTPLLQTMAPAILAQAVGPDAAARFIDPDGAAPRAAGPDGEHEPGPTDALYPVMDPRYPRGKRTRAVLAGERPARPKRAPNGTRHDEVRALLAEPGGRALTGEAIGARLGITAGRARHLRAEVERADAETGRRPHVVELEAAAPGAAARVEEANG